MDRFWRKVNTGDPDKCWEWTGGKSSEGYGVFYLDGKNTGAHRASYMLHYTTDITHLTIHHICGNRLCCNPHHLEALNVLEHGLAHRPDKCKSGHELTEDNIYRRSNGRRLCKACNNHRNWTKSR